MRNGQNDQKTVNCVKDCFHEINKYMQRKPGIKSLYIRRYYVTHGGFRTL